MKTFIVLLINIVLAASGFICTKNTKSADNTPLPSTRPANISFTYYVNGGMMYYYEQLFVSIDSCFYKINDGGAESKIYFKLTKEELDMLYEIFKENRFGEIETYEQKVYDRGGTYISLNWGANSCLISNSGTSFVDDSWKKEWAACVNEMSRIILSEVPKQNKDYEIRFDKSMFNNEIYLQVNQEVVIPKSTLMSENGMEQYISRIVKLSPGMHRLSLNINKKYETVNISPDSSKGIIFSLNDTALTHTYIK